MFFHEIAVLFRGMPVQSIICLILGFIFIVIEIFQPGFGVFGVLGGILTIVGIILRVIVGDGNVLAQVFIILFFDVIFIVIAFVIMIVTSKKGWLNRSPLVESGTAVGIAFSEGTENYAHLIGKMGVAITDLRPIGKANVDGLVYDVDADGFYIRKGEGIKIIATEGTKILVVRAE